jgi:hypothetical protein
MSHVDNMVMRVSLEFIASLRITPAHNCTELHNVIEMWVSALRKRFDAASRQKPAACVVQRAPKLQRFESLLRSTCFERAL